MGNTWIRGYHVQFQLFFYPMFWIIYVAVTSWYCLNLLGMTIEYYSCSILKIKIPSCNCNIYSVSQKSGPPWIVRPPINSFKEGALIQIMYMPQVSAITCHIKWVHLMKWLRNCDFKRKLQWKSNFTTFCNCFVCSHSTI